MRILKNLSIAAMGFMVFLFGLDLFLQAAEIQTPLETTIDPEIGPAFIKGKNVTRFNEGFFIGEVNDMGYFGEERPYSLEPGQRRILLLGDSFVMGATVFARDHFASLLETRMAKEGPSEVQVLNFGRADFNLSNMYQYYEDFASRWDHDLVLYFVGYSDLVPSRQVEQDLYPACVVENDSLYIDYSFRNSARFHQYQLLAPIVSNSALVRMGFNAKKMVMRGELTEMMLGKFSGAILESKSHPDTEKSWPTTELPLLTRKILEKLAGDPRVVVVVKGELPPEMIQEVKAFGFPVWDLYSVLEEMNRQGVDPFYWEVTGKRGHWNHAAHVKIAEFLDQGLQNLHFLDP
ncbi:hypothetical protein KJ682_14265 [bacterium]|nr:hypothetical protein [bacterium]